MKEVQETGHIWLRCSECKTHHWPIRSVRAYTNHLQRVHGKQLRYKGLGYVITFPLDDFKDIGE